jgi:glycosyltransferase involved in cell wall biosynthesis
MLSVIIPAYNEEKLIGKCLESFTRQDTKRQFEVILINNGSTDNTENIAKTYLNKLNLRIIQQPIKGRGGARWLGAKVAKGDILLSTDADTIVHPFWIENMANHFEDKKIISITGSAKVVDNNWFTNMGFTLGYPIVMFIYRIIVGHYWFAGFNFGVRKEIYDKCGGFNKNLNAAEDVDLAFKVTKYGKITFKNDVTIIISGRRLNNNLLKGFLSYSHAYASYIFHRKQYSYLSDIR